MKHKFLIADLLLIITAMIWGWTFIIIKWSVASIDPYFFIYSRFLVAFILLMILFHSRIKQHWRSCLKPGIILGLILALGFITQTLGLKYTTASASGFITGLNVILVTVFAAIITRKLPNKIVLLGILAATAGLLLLTFKGSLEFGKGDLLTLACAALFALHIVYTERLAQNLATSVLYQFAFNHITN
jgi:drug/metabolite transporter (DMT)-like permease